jgi:hypothetical protein
MNHHTNYQKLNLTESLAIIIAILGVGLLSLLGFNSLSVEQKNVVVSGLQVFDIHEQVAHDAQLIKQMSFDFPQEFLQKFYVAFEQTLSLPEDEIAWWQTMGQQTQIALNNFGEFSERIAIHYQSLNQPKIASPPIGQVAGVAITVTDYIGHEVLENIVPEGVKPEIVPINFSPPPEIDFRLLIPKLPNLTY